MAKKKERGRPTIYKPEYIDKIDEYIKKCNDEYEKFIKTEGDKSTSYEYKMKVDLPTKEGFALYIGVDTDTIGNWEKKYPDFFGSIKKIMTEQKKRLMENGLAGRYNPLITKLVLSANHGMNEKTENKTEVTGDGLKINVILPNGENNNA